MSNMELNSGILIPMNLTIQDLMVKYGVDNEGDLYEALYDHDEPYKILNDKVYMVSWDNRAETNVTEICEVEDNGTGAYRFLTYHDNGGDGIWDSVAEKLKENGG